MGKDDWNVTILGHQGTAVTVVEVDIECLPRMVYRCGPGIVPTSRTQIFRLEDGPEHVGEPVES